MRLVIVEGGPLAGQLAQALSARHQMDIVAVSRDADLCRQLVERLGLRAIHGDGTDPDVLDDAEAGAADELIAMAPTDHDNLVVCQLAIKRFLVPRCIALVNDPINVEVFRRLGIEGAFSPVGVLARMIEQRAAFEDVVGLAPVVGGQVHLTEVAVRPGAPAEGRRVCDLGLPTGTLLGYVLREDKAFVPYGDSVIAAGDRLLLITLADDQRPALEALVGSVD